MIGCGGTLKRFLSADRNEEAAAARVHRRVRVASREERASDCGPCERVVVAVRALEVAIVYEPAHLRVASAARIDDRTGKDAVGIVPRQLIDATRAPIAKRGADCLVDSAVVTACMLESGLHTAPDRLDDLLSERPSDLRDL